MTGAILIRANYRGAEAIGSDLSLADLAGADLRVADFAASELSGTNFNQAILNGSNFIGANLTKANLTQANLIRSKALAANFNQSTLTGACLENLQINHHTSFKQVNCQYLYLEHHQKSRIPENTKMSLSSEEFRLTFKDLMEFIEVTFNEDFDWVILLRVFKKLQEKYKSRQIEIRSVEAKFNHRFLAQIKVNSGSDIEEIKQYFKHQYNLLSLAKNNQWNSFKEVKIIHQEQLNSYEQN